MKLTSTVGLVVLSLTYTLVSCVPLGDLAHDDGKSGLLERRGFDDGGQYADLTHVNLDVRAAGLPALKPPTPGGGAGELGAEIGDSLANLFTGLKNEPKLRGDFVKSLIDKTTKAKPGFQAIACHPKHSYKFEGTRGKDWDHSHAEYQKEATPGTVGFEIYWFKKGWFQNEGDGGWENWSYTGSPKKEGKQGHKLTYS